MASRTGSNKSYDEKAAQDSNGSGYATPFYAEGEVEDPLESNEVFKKTHEGVNFRTVSWPKASVIFLKGMNFTSTELLLLLTIDQLSSLLVF